MLSIMPVPMPLQWTAVERWAQRYRLSEDDFQFYCSMLRALDREFLDYEREQMRSSSGGGHDDS